MARLRCEFFLVRYVPDLVKDEFVNIGVVLREANAGPGAPALVRFTRDWSRVRCLDPDVDVPMLEALEEEIRGSQGAAGSGTRSMLRVMEDSFSNSVQLTASKGCLAENLATEMELLMRLYVEPQKREAGSRKSGRQVIYGAMRSQFERAGVWELMRKRIPAASYTQPGDPLRIDCGYRPNGVVRMFQAISLYGDVEMAKVLAFSVPRMSEGVERVEKAKLEFTAIVEPTRAWEEQAARMASRKATAAADADWEAQYDFARDTMLASGIRVMTTGDLADIARTAGQEMRV